jgi:ADP-ribose pyrophosphatase
LDGVKVMMSARTQLPEMNPAEACMAFETIHSQSVYQGRAFSVRKDRVRLPDGGETVLDIVEHVGAVTILPIDADRRVWFVRQYRHAIGAKLLELPAGALEPGESPEACAQRETREEIGMGVKKLEKIGTFYMTPGYCTEFMHAFIASDLFEAPLAGDDDEFLDVEAIPLARIPTMIQNGEIKDSKTLAVFQLARPYLTKSDKI